MFFKQVHCDTGFHFSIDSLDDSLYDSLDDSCYFSWRLRASTWARISASSLLSLSSLAASVS